SSVNPCALTTRTIMHFLGGSQRPNLDNYSRDAACVSLLALRKRARSRKSCVYSRHDASTKSLPLDSTISCNFLRANSEYFGVSAFFPKRTLAQNRSSSLRPNFHT